MLPTWAENLATILSSAFHYVLLFLLKFESRHWTSQVLFTIGPGLNFLAYVSSIKVFPSPFFCPVSAFLIRNSSLEVTIRIRSKLLETNFFFLPKKIRMAPFRKVYDFFLYCIRNLFRKLKKAFLYHVSRWNWNPGRSKGNVGSSEIFFNFLTLGKILILPVGHQPPSPKK